MPTIDYEIYQRGFLVNNIQSSPPNTGSDFIAPKEFNILGYY